MIAGPTASGKSQLAMDLASALDGEVVNADSIQFYSDLSILTARPSDRDMKGISHHLYGVLDGAQRASVAIWLGLAAEAMAAIWARGRMPIVIGVTGMYLDGTDLSGVRSGGITHYEATVLPAWWDIVNGYLIGPGANLTNANLTGCLLYTSPSPRDS